ncbi:MAG: hypothetical protein LBJ13_00700 [Puniceicoccales bacterium]|nr:hypothetical protein [Puniceicoccales bacterium]
MFSKIYKQSGMILSSIVFSINCSAAVPSPGAICENLVGLSGEFAAKLFGRPVHFLSPTDLGSGVLGVSEDDFLGKYCQINKDVFLEKYCTLCIPDGSKMSAFHAALDLVFANPIGVLLMAQLAFFLDYFQQGSPNLKIEIFFDIPDIRLFYGDGDPSGEKFCASICRSIYAEAKRLKYSPVEKFLEEFRRLHRKASEIFEMNLASRALFLLENDMRSSNPSRRFIVNLNSSQKECVGLKSLETAEIVLITPKILSLDESLFHELNHIRQGFFMLGMPDSSLRLPIHQAQHLGILESIKNAQGKTFKQNLQKSTLLRQIEPPVHPEAPGFYSLFNDDDGELHCITGLAVYHEKGIQKRDIVCDPISEVFYTAAKAKQNRDPFCPRLVHNVWLEGFRRPETVLTNKPLHEIFELLIVILRRLGLM